MTEFERGVVAGVLSVLVFEFVVFFSMGWLYYYRARQRERNKHDV
jgi:hypothetical protein